MYVDGKMRPVETIPSMGGRGIKENNSGREFNYDIFKIFVNVIMYPQYNNKKEKKKTQSLSQLKTLVLT
jgi:hypothetical protein